MWWGWHLEDSSLVSEGHSCSSTHEHVGPNCSSDNVSNFYVSLCDKTWWDGKSCEGKILLQTRMFIELYGASHQQLLRKLLEADFGEVALERGHNLQHAPNLIVADKLRSRIHKLLMGLNFLTDPNRITWCLFRTCECQLSNCQKRLTENLRNIRPSLPTALWTHFTLHQIELAYWSWAAIGTKNIPSEASSAVVIRLDYRDLGGLPDRGNAVQFPRYESDSWTVLELR